jgi:hypothetical protein
MIVVFPICLFAAARKSRTLIPATMIPQCPIIGNTCGLWSKYVNPADKRNPATGNAIVGSAPRDVTIPATQKKYFDVFSNELFMRVMFFLSK